MKAHFRMMAAYNAWANRRLYDAAGRLGDADYRADLGAAFRSVHGTLNHLVVGDVLWLARFRGQPQPPLRLDQILHEDRAELCAAREALDAEIVDFVEALSAADLAATITYSMITRPETVTEPIAPALTHFFNHQTHHRGQVHALLTRLTGQAPALDLIYHLREAA
ncbi:MAG TPA: DinB family protein [Thermohalobaculum sp.]|nr:DinB family protein [Thermohalobaculum sp.]